MLHILFGAAASWISVALALVGVSAVAVVIESAVDWLFDAED